MPVKIRLTRHGRKRLAYYHIVAADSRAPRDGKFIEKLGVYNPNTNPATIELNFEKALYWLQNGAQPSDTARAILSYKGVLMKKHLLDGVKKGAFDENAAEEKFSQWLTDKASKIQAKVDRLNVEGTDDLKSRIEAERKVNEARVQAIAEKAAAEAKAAAKSHEPEVEEVEETVEAIAEETVEVATEETTEAVAEEKSEE